MRMHSVLNMFFQNPSVARRKSDALRSAFLVRVFLPFTSLGSFTYTAVESTKNKKPSHYLLSVEKMATLSLAGVFQKPEGWIEMP